MPHAAIESIARASSYASASPSFWISKKRSGVTYSRTGACFGEGRRYWPTVRKSTPAARRSTSERSTSSSLSPRPTISDDLVNSSGSSAFAPRSVSSERSKEQRGSRMRRWSRETTSTLCANTSGRAATSVARSSPR